MFCQTKLVEVISFRLTVTHNGNSLEDGTVFITMDLLGEEPKSTDRIGSTVLGALIYSLWFCNFILPPE